MRKLTSSSRVAKRSSVVVISPFPTLCGCTFRLSSSPCLSNALKQKPRSFSLSSIFQTDHSLIVLGGESARLLFGLAKYYKCLCITDNVGGRHGGVGKIFLIEDGSVFMRLLRANAITDYRVGVRGGVYMNIALRDLFGVGRGECPRFTLPDLFRGGTGVSMGVFLRLALCQLFFIRSGLFLSKQRPLFGIVMGVLL